MPAKSIMSSMGWFVSALNLLFSVIGALLLIAVRQAPMPAFGAAVVLAAGIATLVSIWFQKPALRGLFGPVAIVLHLLVVCLGVGILFESISEHQQGDILGGWTTWLSPGLFLAVPLLSIAFLALALVRRSLVDRNNRPSF